MPYSIFHHAGLYASEPTEEFREPASSRCREALAPTRPLQAQPSPSYAFFPASEQLERIGERWKELAPDESFQSLVAYVRSRQPRPCVRETPQVRQTTYTISGLIPGTHRREQYCSAFVLPQSSASWGRDQRTLKLEMLAILELGVAYAIAATADVPRPTRGLLATAQDYCLLFDEKREELKRIIHKRLEDRSKGGKARTARLNPAREYARHLYVQRRPPQGWKSTAAAIREIMSQVIAFARTHRLAVFAGHEEDAIRTIRSWLKDLKDDASGKA